MVSADVRDGPPQQTNWNLTVDDQFQGSTLDTERWAPGFGWGMSADFDGARDDATVVTDNISVKDGRLVLDIEHGGGGPDDVTQGAINSKNRQTFAPGTYVEARMKMPGRTGVLPAFWSIPTDESWPPEIDIVELFQSGDDAEYERKTAWSNVHYADSPNDASTHEEAGPWACNEGIDLTETFNTYGCAWHEDRIEFYFNGTLVQQYDDPDGMEKVNAGAPFYLMFSNHVNRLGEPDYSEAWHTTMEVEWCRIWEYGSDGSGGDGGDRFLAVDTLGVSNVTDTSAILSGIPTDLDGAESVNCGFEWRRADAAEWTETSLQTLGTSEEYAVEIGGLESDTAYEFRAIVRTDGAAETGEVATFATDSATVGTAAPGIDRVETQDRSNPRWTRTRVDWAVSDDDGDLEAVTTELRLDSTDELLDAKTSSVSGSEAASRHDLRGRSRSGDSYFVTITATDARGNSTSKSTR